MPRKGYVSENLSTFEVLDALPADYSGQPWTKIYRTINKDGPRMGKEAFCKYLEKLVTSRQVIHEGKLYRRNPTYRLEYDRYRDLLNGSRLPSFSKENPFPEDRLQHISTWTDDAYHQHHAGKIQTLEDVFVQIEETLTSAYTSYLTMLLDLATISNKTAAREFATLFIKVQIESRFLDIAHSVWEKRQQIKIDQLSKQGRYGPYEGPLHWIDVVQKQFGK